MRTATRRWWIGGLSILVVWGASDSATAQTIERFRFKAAADWKEPMRFETRIPWANPAVNVGGFRHATGPTNRRGRVYLLGPGVTSPGEIPTPKQKSPKEIKKKLVPFDPKSKAKSETPR